MSPPFKGVMKSLVQIWMIIALWKYQQGAAATMKHAEYLVPICIFWHPHSLAHSELFNGTTIVFVVVSLLSLLSMFLSTMLQGTFICIYMRIYEHHLHNLYMTALLETMPSLSKLNLSDVLVPNSSITNLKLTKVIQALLSTNWAL